MTSLHQRRTRSEEEKGHHHRDSNHDGWNFAVPNWSGGPGPNPDPDPDPESIPASSLSSSTTDSAVLASSTEGYYTNGVIATTYIPSSEPTVVQMPSEVWRPSITPSGSSEASGPVYVGPESQGGLGDKVVAAIAGTLSMMALVIIGLIAFFCLRKRRRQRQQQASQSQMQQIKRGNEAYTPARTRTSTIYPQYAAPPNHAPPTLAVPPPVILGPIVPGSNGAYYTGIDTSDVVSVHDRTGLGNPFADGDSLNDEPPPPYRPRSFGLMSRNTSLRAPPVTTSQTHLIGGDRQPGGSPFEDPLDDDAISIISSSAPRGTNDRMSVVSDLSYQEDPVVTRPAV